MRSAWVSIIFSALIGLSKSAHHLPGELGFQANNFFNLPPQGPQGSQGPQGPQGQSFFQSQQPPPPPPIARPPPVAQPFVQPFVQPRPFSAPPTAPTMPSPPPAPVVIQPPTMIQQVFQPAVSAPAPTRPFQCQSGELRLGASAVTFRFNNRVYWFSWSDRSNAQKSWVDAERVCRQLCMELVSLDTPGETEFVASMIPKADIHGLWTGGRLCNFAGCEKDPKFQPVSVNGWMWATKGTKIGSDPGGRWSSNGGLGKPQPDNLFGSKGGESEDCIALLSNWYNDGNNVFHDLACSEPLPFVCEQP